MGPRAGLDAVEKRKFLPLPGIERRPTSQHPISVPAELSRLLSPSRKMLLYTSIRPQPLPSRFVLTKRQAAHEMLGQTSCTPYMHYHVGPQIRRPSVFSSDKIRKKTFF
jgi:hypothetical protein